MWTQQQPLPTARHPQDHRRHTAFVVAAAGAGLCLVGIFLTFVSGTNSYTGLGEDVKGLDEFGVGWWPVVWALVAVAALLVADRRPDLSASALGAVATAAGVLDLVYVIYRRSDVEDRVQELTGGVVSVGTGAGFSLLVVGAVGVVIGAGWWTLLARGALRGGTGRRGGPGGPRFTRRAATPATPTAAPPMYGGAPGPMPTLPPPAPVATPAPPPPPSAVYPGQAPPPR